MPEGVYDFDSEKIKGQAREKLEMCRKTNDIIGSQIFSILGIYARVIYFPLGQEAPWGFTRISGLRDDTAALPKPFVAINTSIPLDCQVFAAAHELYHIWYEKNPDILSSNLLDEADNKMNEKKANRFAAEFLMDEVMLRQEIDIYKIQEISIGSILQLANLFVVPYRAMTKRLYEIGVIDKEELRKFLSESEDSIQQYRKRYAFIIPKPDERIAMDNLAELAVSAYEFGLVTYEKLEFLLELCGLKPDDLGIRKEAGNPFPSDEELDGIMEE